MWNRRVRARLLVRLQERVLALGSNHCRVSLFRQCADRRRRERFRRQFLVRRAAAGTGTTAGDLRIVRAAAGLAEIAAGVLADAVVVVADAGVAVAEADRAGIAAGVLGANFPLRSMHRHGHLRIRRASRERQRDTSQLCCRENLSRSSGSEALRIFRRRLRKRTRTTLKPRQTTRQVLPRLSPLRMNRKRMGTCMKRYTKKRTKEWMNP